MVGWEWLKFQSVDLGETDASELCVLLFKPGAQKSRVILLYLQAV